MERVITCITVVAICLLINGCSNKISIDNSNTPSGTISDNEKNNKDIPTGEIQISTFSNREIKPLEASDFTITDGEISIKLDSPYKEFKIDMPEEKLDNNYVGETYSGEYIYKTYIHKFADFDLYVSNLNYNFKDRNFDEYYITQITLKNLNFVTLRGITIGSNVEDINNAYGPAEKSIIDGKTILIYKLNDMEMSFRIGENQKVQDVILRIVVKDVQ